MMNYFKAQTAFSSARDKSRGKPIGSNTRIVKTEKGYGIKYHNTVVVEMLLDGIYILRSGGWHTATTKRRITEYGPVRIYQKDFNWFLSDGNPFVDGMVVNSSGEVVTV
jgi:hypothetical protein